MTNQDQHCCPYRDEFVAIRVGMEQCITDHQCFSDDPCPLQSEFDRLSARAIRQKKVSVAEISSKRQALS